MIRLFPKQGGRGRVSIRWWLMTRFGGALVGSVLLMSFLAYRVLVVPGIEERQLREFDAVTSRAEDRLHRTQSTLEQKLFLLRGPLEEAGERLADDGKARAHLGSVLGMAGEAEGVVLADSSGRSRSLLRKEGVWLERWVSRRDVPSRLCILDSATLRSRSCSTMVGDLYDATSREWFLAAMKGKGPAWSGLFRFRFNGGFGQTLALPMSGPGAQRIAGIHLLLRRELQVTKDMKIGKDGFVFLADSVGRLFSRPYGRGSDAWLLRPLVEIPDAVVAGAHATTVRAGAAQMLAFRVAGEDWLVYARMTSFAGQALRICVVMPKVQAQAGRETALLFLGASIVALLGFGLFLTGRVASSLTMPLEELGRRIEQIGKLDFKAKGAISTPWLEMENLIQAHEGMTMVLEQTTANMEEEIQEKTSQLRKFYLAIEQSSFAVIITDGKGNIEYVNPYALRSSGYTLEDLVGRNPRILRSPDADPMALVDLWDTIKIGEIWKGEFLNRSKYGRDYLESAIVAPIFDGEVITHFVAIKEDVTQIKAAQKQISDQLALFEQVLDAIPNPVFLKDSKLRYTLCNRAYEDAFGTIREFVQGKTVMDFPYLTHAEKEARNRDDLRVLHGGIEIHEPLQARLADGKIHDLMGWLKQFKLADGSVGGILGMMMDITDMKGKERELDAARAKAEEATRAKSAFLASMSHEIRTPMNAVIGMAHLALRTSLDPQQKDYIKKIHHAATALLAILNDILDFSKIEAGKMGLERQEFSLADLLASVADLHRHKAREKGLEYLHRVAKQLPEHFVGDSLRLGQILTNLLGNAIKFTESGEVELSAGLVDQGDDWILVKFSVRDTGVGLTEEQQRKLFQAFSQADDSSTRKYGGTGLGLAISKKLAELMGGQIGVQSEFGHGCTFWFTARLGRTQGVESDFPFDTSGCRTLVVDDNPVVSEVLAAYLTSMGMEAECASSGKQAVQMLAEADGQGRPYEIMFLDRKMPGEDGIEVAKQVKASALGRIPAVVMVTSVDEELHALCRSIPLEGILDKPVSPHALRRVLDDILGREPSGADSSIFLPDLGLSGLKVLVVENEPVNQQIARELLDSQGVDAAVVGDGIAALERLELEDFDIVLMDLQMPRMDGFEATRRLREKGLKTPILAMTASAMYEERQASLDAGMNDHIAKPVEPKKLYATLAKWMPKGRDASPSLKLKEPLRAFPYVPGIETEEGLERCGGNAEMYAQFLREFAETRLDLEELRALLERDDDARARAWLHSFKGIAGNLGAMSLFAVVAGLERCIREESVDVALSHLPRLEDMAEELRRDILLRLDEPVSRSEEPSPGELNARIGRIVSLLRDADADAVDEFDKVRKSFAVAHGQGLATRLSRKIRDYAFDEALEILMGTPDERPAGNRQEVEE